MKQGIPPARLPQTVHSASDGVTTATANITFDDVMDLFYSLKAPYRKKAVWLLNDTTVKTLIMVATLKAPMET